MPHTALPALQHYYRRHAPLYDFTRWSFLFGRRRLIGALPALPARPRILEVGCGTGSNLVCLQRRFPRARITGIDLSPAMLRRAEAKFESSAGVQLIHGTYGDGRHAAGPYDLILCSYSLTMTGPRREAVVRQIARDLAPGGCLCAVDFHDTPSLWFQRWMNRNHVRIDGSLLPGLEVPFSPVHAGVHRAYGGLWRYFCFIGRGE